MDEQGHFGDSGTADGAPAAEPRDRSRSNGASGPTGWSPLNASWSTADPEGDWRRPPPERDEERRFSPSFQPAPPSPPQQNSWQEGLRNPLRDGRDPARAREPLDEPPGRRDNRGEDPLTRREDPLSRRDSRDDPFGGDDPLGMDTLGRRDKPSWAAGSSPLFPALGNGNGTLDPLTRGSESPHGSDAPLRPDPFSPELLHGDDITEVRGNPLLGGSRPASSPPYAQASAPPYAPASAPPFPRDREPARHALEPTPYEGLPQLRKPGVTDESRSGDQGRERASYDPSSFPRRLPYEAPMSTPGDLGSTGEQAFPALPQRVPARPDVPTVPEPPSVEPTAETPALARIATHLRRDDALSAPEERHDGFDVNAILEAVREVDGVRDAALRMTPAGAHSLRLDLSEGADPAEVSRKVARLLQERMGLDAAMQGAFPLGGVAAPPVPGASGAATRMPSAGGQPRPASLGPAPRSAPPGPAPRSAPPGPVPRSAPPLPSRSVSPAAPERTGFDRATSDRLASDRATSDRLASERTAPDRLASERAASDRTAPQTRSAAAAAAASAPLPSVAPPVAPRSAPPASPRSAPPASARPSASPRSAPPASARSSASPRSAPPAAPSSSARSAQAQFPLTRPEKQEGAPGSPAPMPFVPSQPSPAARPLPQRFSNESVPAGREQGRPLRTSGEKAGPRVVIENVQVNTMSTEAIVKVTLGVEGQTSTGEATGPAVDGYLLRLCATATANAVDHLLTRSDHADGPAKCFVEHAASVPFGAVQVAVVVVLLATDGWVEQLAGSAVVTGDERHAVVRATLAAVNRRLEALLS